MKQYSLKFGLLALSALLLSSCVPDSSGLGKPAPAPSKSIIITESDYKPDSLTFNQELVIRSDNLGTVLLGGSGTCPPVIKEATFENETLRLILDSEAYKNKMCTMDYTLHAYDLELSGSKFTPSIKAYLVSENTETELKVISE